MHCHAFGWGAKSMRAGSDPNGRRRLRPLHAHPRKKTSSHPTSKLSKVQNCVSLKKNINEFLKKEEVKRLIDVKFTAISQNDVEKYTALILL